jgi:lipopolysaccharide export system ATP-binding protein
MKHSLSAKKIQKSYKARKVVADIDLEINNGEIVGLLGPNGAGKTTSFYIITGLIKADSGRITLNDEDITDSAMHVRARLGIGYLPQEASVFRKLSVFDNIMAVLQLRKELSQQQRREKCQTLMSKFQIEEISDSLGASLSGGERRRVEIARALATDPKFILLDEPFAGIDPISIVDIKQVIKQLAADGIGILITDHNVRETLDICTRAYIMNKGIVIADGDAETILNNETVRKVYLGESFDLP